MGNQPGQPPLPPGYQPGQPSPPSGYQPGQPSVPPGYNPGMNQTQQDRLAQNIGTRGIGPQNLLQTKVGSR